jgi:prepilin-type N-terminal cleavage/methylation domain-containing protein
MIAHNFINMRCSMKNQKGFTLVEMAIVLVIIGLLLGGVLKGQELIDNSKIKNAINDLKGISAANNGYFDRFRAQPGDDGPLATLQARGGSWATITLGGNANGNLDVTAAQTFTGAGENATFFQHVRAAGFLAGDQTLVANVAALPVNSFGGVMGVTANAVTGMPLGKYVCASRIPGKAARAIDVSMDNGDPDSGTIMATTAVAGANTAPGAAATVYVDTAVYTLCAPL